VTSPAPPAPGATDGPASFTASYTLSEAEQARANRYVTHRRWTTWAAYFVFALFLVIHWTFKRRWRFDWSSIVLTLVFIGLAGYVYARPWLVVRRARKSLTHPDGPFTITLQESGLTFASPMVTSTVAWPVFRAVSESDEFLLLYWSKDGAMVIPKKVLTPQLLDAFWWVVGRWAPHLVRHSRRT
jgi:YcxB-like protein